MKLVCLFFVMCALVGCADDGTPAVLPELPGRISELPKTIRVVPESGPIVWAERTDDPSLEYEWARTLYVLIDDASVRVVEFGVFAWIDGTWIAADTEGKPHTGDTFAEWFRCDDATLIPGQVYRSSMFTTVGNVLPDTESVYRWYFIGEGPDGLCRGEVTVRNVPPMQPIVDRPVSHEPSVDTPR